MTDLTHSCRVAFAALVHNLAHFAKCAGETAGISPIQTYFPPSFLETNPLIQQVIDSASRIASQKTEVNAQNLSQAQLFSLFEQISLSEQRNTAQHQYVYPIKPLSAASIFPHSLKHKGNHQAEYAELWLQFVRAFEAIPSSHKHNEALWLDHFDTLYQSYTSCIPSPELGQYADISLYDQSKTTAALATAMWHWHQENENVALDDSEKQKFLLIQGDFFGIQDFIFSGGRATNKQAAKLLRGRSFQVSLFTELAALKVLQACELPSTSQMLNAAGKFLIVAPNTERVKQAVKTVQNSLNQWFVEHTYGLVGVGIATTEACSNDFAGKNFPKLLNKLFTQLEEIKLQRLDLTASTESVQDVQYPFGTCDLNQNFPAVSEDEKRSLISKDQISIGELLIKKDRLMICSEKNEIFANDKTQSLSLPIFGYNVIFTQEQDETGKFGELAKNKQLYRFWDFSLPKSVHTPIWNGYARRYINTYVALFNALDNYTDKSKYKNIDEDNQNPKLGTVKTFDYLACEDRQLNGDKYVGQVALMTLKGDVDNLGLIFQKGLDNSNFAKMATLSRQMNQFFSLWLPAYCQEKKLNVYTVFAGGDDFFLIGAWRSTQALAHTMHLEFANYVAKNPEIHFSAGMVMTKVGIPVPRLGDLAELALEKAKELKDDSGKVAKNAVTLYNRAVTWAQFKPLQDLEDEIAMLAEEYRISTSYLYSLIALAEQAELAEKGNIQASMWRSHFAYKTARYVVDKLPKEKRESAVRKLLISLADKGIATHRTNMAIPVFNYFYQKR